MYNWRYFKNSGRKKSQMLCGDRRDGGQEYCKKLKPKMILSVACERDLTSGIIDVGKIPVVGIVNERPNGPCYNTCVDVSVLKDKLDSIIK